MVVEPLSRRQRAPATLAEITHWPGLTTFAEHLVRLAQADLTVDCFPYDRRQPPMTHH
jgi:hypothetical protein